jgi:hypothetical protein
VEERVEFIYTKEDWDQRMAAVRILAQHVVELPAEHRMHAFRRLLQAGSQQRNRISDITAASRSTCLPLVPPSALVHGVWHLGRHSNGA